MSKDKRLTIVLVLNLLLIASLVAVGLRAHSLGVLAAGGDYLADAAAIAVSLFAIRLARRPATARHPDGYPRATNIAALVNAGWLLVLSALIAVAAVRRLVTGAPTIDGLPVLIVSAVAAVAMLAGALVLGGDLDQDDERDDEGEDLNMKAVLLDTAADAAAAGGVAVTGSIILAAGGLYWLDPTVALLIALVVGYHALKLVRKLLPLLRSAPRTRPAA